MKAVIFLSSFLILLVNSVSIAQVELSFNEYISEKRAFVSLIAPHETGNILSIHNTDSFGKVYFSIISTNPEGEELDRIERLELEGIETSALTYLGKHGDLILGLATVFDDEEGYKFVSFSVTPDLEVNIIDTVILIRGTALLFLNIERNLKTGLLEGFGEILDENYYTDGYLYLSMQKDGTFESLNFDINFPFVRPMMDFIFHPGLDQYMGAIFPAFTVFADKDFSILEYGQNRYPQVRNDTTFNHSFIQSDCVPTQTGAECLGVGMETDHRIAIVEWSWTEDNTEIVDAHPITPSGMEFSIENVIGERDELYNLYFCAKGYSFYLNDTPEPNFLYLAKYNIDRELEWDIVFRDDVNEYLARTLAFDEAGNFLVGGEMTTIEGRTNFMLKVGPSTTSTNTVSQHMGSKVKAFPNPTLHFLNVDVDSSMLPCRYHIYDNLGKLIQTGEFTATSSILDMSNLPTGTYHLSMLKDENAVSKRIVKY